jgi:hypothetical protein
MARCSQHVGIFLIVSIFWPYFELLYVYLGPTLGEFSISTYTDYTYRYINYKEYFSGVTTVIVMNGPDRQRIFGMASVSCWCDRFSKIFSNMYRIK